MSASEILREFVGQRCRCGNWKPEAKAFCKKCYEKLPYTLQIGLYKRFGKGYEEAFTAALEALGFVAPEEKQKAC